MAEAVRNYVYEPSKPKDELKMVHGPRAANITVEEILTDTVAARRQENIDRVLKVLSSLPNVSDPHFVGDEFRYTSTLGGTDPVNRVLDTNYTLQAFQDGDYNKFVDLRDEDQESIAPNSRRVLAAVLEDTAELNSTTHMRLSDFAHEDWATVVANLEKEGRVVSVQTAANPHGYYADRRMETEGNEGTPEGYRLEDKQITAIRVTNIGGQISSQEPQKPKFNEKGKLEKGLNHIPTHGMAIARYAANPDYDPAVPGSASMKWHDTHIVPSGKLALAGANNTAMQYAQTIFEGLVAAGMDAKQAVEVAGEEMLAHLGQGGVRNIEVAGAEAKTIVEAPLLEVNITNGRVNLFRVRQNAERFNESARTMGMPIIPVDQFIQSVMAAVTQNLAYIPQEGEGQLYVRPYMIGASGGAGANPAQNYVFAVEVFPFGDYTNDDLKIEARKDIHRPEFGGTAKAGPSYGPGFAEKAALKKRGMDDILCVDHEGNLEEYTTASPFFVVRLKGGELALVTSRVNRDTATGPKKKYNNLDSITRRSIIEMARAKGTLVMAVDTQIDDLFKDGEDMEFIGAFRAGTAAGLTTVKSITVKETAEDKGRTKEFNDAEAASFMAELKDLLMKARRGELEGDLAHLNREWVTSFEVHTDQLLEKPEPETAESPEQA